LDIDPEFLGILTLRGLATGDDRPMIIYNGALDRTWTDITGYTAELRGRTLWHRVIGLMVGISRNVSIVETNVVGHSQYIKTSLNMIPK
jgi:hypothetical protein